MSLSKLRLVVAGGLAALALGVPGVGHFLPTSRAAPPAASAAAKDPLDRIKLARLTTLLKPEGIQKDLGLTDDQKTKIEAARKKLSEDILEAMRSQSGVAIGGVARAVPAVPPAGGPGGGGGVIIGGVGGVMSGTASSEAGKIMAEHQATFEQTALATLSETQVHRLKQIFIQSQGAAGLLDRRVIRTLELSADQEDEIDKVLPAAFNGRSFSGDRVKEADDALAAAVKVLTPGQKEKWTALVGKPIPTVDLLQTSGPVVGGSFSVTGGGVMPIQGGVVPPPKK